MFVRTQVIIPFDTAIPRDAAVNTFHFRTDGLDTETNELADINGALTACYQAFDQLLSPNVGPSATIRHYDLSDAEPRVPIGESTFTLTPGTAPYPNELAVCVSFQGSRVSGTSQRRRRGRVYIGPLGGASIVVDDVGDVVIASADRLTIANAFGAMIPEVPGTSTSFISWSVFSRATFAATGSLDAAFVPIVDGWIDNKFDIQRRRGTAPTSRQVFS